MLLPLQTKNSYRTINISDNFVKFLKELKEEQTENKKLYWGEWFNQCKRKWWDNSIKFLSRIIKDDLHVPFKFHNLRHTYATILAESGISPRYVQEMIGDSKLEFTLKYYTHITGHMADMARMPIDKMIQI